MEFGKPQLFSSQLLVNFKLRNVLISNNLMYYFEIEWGAEEMHIDPNDHHN